MTDPFPELIDFNNKYPRSPHPGLGGMKLSYCCFTAFNTSLDIQNGSLVITRPEFFPSGTTAWNILEADQFPCTAVYNGNHTGAPIVRSSFQWCNSMCPGWQISQSKKLQQWVGPMVAFILPSMVFCLSIPRRRKLEVSDSLFMPRLGRPWKYFISLLGFLAAATIVSADILSWLSLCFAFAGPMVLSGIYEAFLDKRILDFVNHGLDDERLEKQLATKLLYIILVGNLDFDWSLSRSPSFSRGFFSIYFWNSLIDDWRRQGR